MVLDSQHCTACTLPDDLCVCGWLGNDTPENPKENASRRKVPLQLNPPVASHYQAFVHQNGADKYGEWNWRESGINLTTYVGAAKRHMDGLMRGEWLDPESGLPHWAHITACGAISLDAWAHGKLNDDRPPGRPNELPACDITEG